MIKIAVVDDDPTILDMISKKVDSYGQIKGVKTVTAAFSAAKFLLYELEDEQSFHIYLLDIEMPEMSGMELAAKIREYDRCSYIIFITSHLKYAVEGYELGIHRFIPKDNLAEKLTEALDSVLEELTIQKDKSFMIQTNNRIEIIEYRDIYYLYKDEKNTIFVTRSGRSRVRKPLEKVYQELNNEDFVYIDRGYVVNLFHVMKFEKGQLLIRNQELLPVSRGNKQKLKAEIYEFWR